MTGGAGPDAYDVAVVSYGPTGLALAAWLGRAGHRTVVIERWPQLYQLPRAGHVDAEVMRLFQKLGVAETILTGDIIRAITVTGTRKELVERIKGLKALGFKMAQFRLVPVHEEEMMHRWADVMAEVNA